MRRDLPGSGNRGDAIGWLWATYEAVPDPKLVIAVGACACEAGFLAGSYALAGSVDRRLPIDVYIPGCPPRPSAILHGLLLAVGRQRSRGTTREWRRQPESHLCPGPTTTEF